MQSKLSFISPFTLTQEANANVHPACAMALAPTVGACGIAAAQAEIDLITDAACITAAISLGTNFPSSCTACAKRFGNEASNVGGEIKSKLPFHL
ncbi:hypothetical protein GYMLUDRAFT_68371 [Collybiopsis luxurians FD-317 M1]|nr:hypothetical protein GYMLUDRAFT_68371 [Collybiopsis luxurians FD-317 M1]